MKPNYTKQSNTYPQHGLGRDHFLNSTVSLEGVFPVSHLTMAMTN